MAAPAASVQQWSPATRPDAMLWEYVLPVADVLSGACTVTVSNIEFQLRSAENTWCYEKWECLPDDGNRYEVIDGVLYMSTAPDNVHQLISACLTEYVGIPLKRAGVAIYAYAPIGVLMPGAQPVQPD